MSSTSLEGGVGGRKQVQAKGEAASANSSGNCRAEMTSRRYPALSLNRETFKAYALIIDAYGFPQRIRYLLATEAIRKNTASPVQSSDGIYKWWGPQVFPSRRSMCTFPCSLLASCHVIIHS